MFSWCTWRAEWPIFSCPEWNSSVGQPHIRRRSYKHWGAIYYLLNQFQWHIHWHESRSVHLSAVENLRGSHGVVFGRYSTHRIRLNTAKNSRYVAIMSANSGKESCVGTTCTVPHKPCHDYGQYGWKLDFVQLNGQCTTFNEETSCRIPRMECAVWWVSCIQKAAGCNTNTPGNGSVKTPGWLPALGTCRHKESTGNRETLMNGCTSIWMSAAYSFNATCATMWKWRSSTFRNRQCATLICIHKDCSPQYLSFQPWCLCK